MTKLLYALVGRWLSASHNNADTQISNAYAECSTELQEVLNSNVDAYRAAILREGFERGAQWAIMDHAYRTTNFAIVGPDGSVEGKERDAAIAQILDDLFVPKLP